MTRLKAGRRGLSPPTRGNRRSCSRQPPRGGSIPAHAGEPETDADIIIPGEVYPRPRGGTPDGLKRAACG